MGVWTIILNSVRSGRIPVDLLKVTKNRNKKLRVEKIKLKIKVRVK